MTDRVRADAMARRIARTAGRLGIDAHGQELLRAAFELGMRPRFRRNLDDHHPDYLHPARTALILMDDARIADVPTLAAALVAETRDATLAVDGELGQDIGPAAAAVAAEVAGTAGDPPDAAEKLVTASRGAVLVAVAERLDHARHLHLRDRAEWAPYHAVTCAVYGPVAGRVDAALAGRIRWWCDTFRDRFLDG